METEVLFKTFDVDTLSGYSQYVERDGILSPGLYATLSQFGKVVFPPQKQFDNYCFLVASLSEPIEIGLEKREIQMYAWLRGLPPNPDSDMETYLGNPRPQILPDAVLLAEILKITQQGNVNPRLDKVIAYFSHIFYPNKEFLPPETPFSETTCHDPVVVYWERI